ncbi:MAG TPA: rhomboid family intramembrane serine protease [Vicinamibacterales bacterium]|nr:rhomboid family intramembrane serine protease [Vicinamibacterales bacterium]
MLSLVFKRQKTGSVVCSSCGSLVGVNDDKCYICGRRNPGLWGFAPLVRRFGHDVSFVTVVIYGCSVLYAATLLVAVALGENIFSGSIFSMLGPGTRTLFLFGASGSYPVFVYGRWWTILSAGWLHAGILHILFNMLWVRQLGPAVADIYGGARMVIIYTIACAAGFLLSSFMGAYAPIPFLSGAGLTIGASAPIFGLLGALVHYGKRGGSSAIRSEALMYAVVLFVFGLVMPGIDNAAHAGGFAGGYLASLWLDPLRRERTDHFIGAAICLVLTVLSIAASIVTVFL